MKRSDFKKLIGEATEPIIRKVIKEELQSLIEEMGSVESMQEEVQYKAPSLAETLNTEPQISENASISDILAMTKPFEGNERTAVGYTQQPPAQPNLQMGREDVPGSNGPLDLIESAPAQGVGSNLRPVSGRAKEVLDAKIDQDPTLKKGEKLVMKALTKDYSALIRKQMESGRQRKPVYKK